MVEYAVSRPKGQLPHVRFNLSKSAGHLAWDYFASIGGWQGMEAPWLVRYTEDGLGRAAPTHLGGALHGGPHC